MNHELMLNGDTGSVGDDNRPAGTWLCSSYGTVTSV
jgi:hypothetical protein